MKKLLLISIGAALAISANAQLSTNTILNASGGTTTTTFFQSAQSFLTSFNPAFTWTNVTIEASTGYKQVTGSGATDIAQGQYDIGRFNIGALVGFDGAGSTVGTLQAQIGYALVEYEDTKLDIDLQPGYSWYQKAFVIEPELAVSKKLTENTFTRIGISLPYYAGQSFSRTPSFEISLGFTF